MKTLIVFFLIVLYTISASAQFNNLKNNPRTYYPQVFFDKSAAENALKKGNSSIKGVASDMDEVTGQTYFANQSVVILIPYTAYFEEWFNLWKKYKNYGYYTIHMQFGVFETRLETYTDDKGSFEFKNLKPGKYYIQSFIKYQTNRLGRAQAGTIYGYGYATPIYQYTNNTFNTKENAYKVIEIPSDGNTMTLDLKPRGPSLLNTEAIGAKTSKINCYSENNMKFGTCYEYYPNGATKEIAEWSKNFYDGDYKGYAQNGNVIGEGKFKKGFKIDEWNYYDEDLGKLTQTENFVFKKDKSFLEGNLNFYYPNGNLRQVDKYIEGKTNGETIVYYENGKVKSKVIYIDGVLNGLALYYNENGEKTKELTFKNGQPSN